MKRKMENKIESKKKKCVITGSNSGIGIETAIALAKRGYHIIMVVREGKKSDLAFERIKKESDSSYISKFHVVVI